MTPLVEVRNLSKRYGRHVAVHEVSIEVGDRQVMGLLGPNGSGKSTILRMIAGYLAPTSGSLRVAGVDVARDSVAARARIGYVPEDVPLYPHMRVDELLQFMGSLRALRGAALRAAIERVSEHLQLGGVRRTLIGKLSRGFRQRVAIAVATLHEPPLLILDEPTNGLDPRQIIELRASIRRLAQRCSVLVTSHVLSEIERVADRVAILVDGRLLLTTDIARAHAEMQDGLRSESPLERLFLEITAPHPHAASVQ